MFKSFDYIYLLILIAVAVGVILLMWGVQRILLKRLGRTLYQQNDPVRYAQMLDAKGMKIAFRPATLCLLRLEGAIFAKDAPGVWAAADALDAARPRNPEKLNGYQKALSFAVSNGDKKHAKAYLNKLEKLLANEKDPKITAILAEARLLVGVYIDKNQKFAPKLEEAIHSQSGAKKGISLYRLAKLRHYIGDDGSAKDYLHKAQPLLAGTAWEKVAAEALADPKVLEEI